MLEGCTTTLGVHGTTEPMRSSPRETKDWMGELKATADRGSPRRMRKTSTKNEDLVEDLSTEAEARGNPSEPSRVKPGSTSRCLARCSLPEKDQPAIEKVKEGGGFNPLAYPRMLTLGFTDCSGRVADRAPSLDGPSVADGKEEKRASRLILVGPKPRGAAHSSGPSSVGLGRGLERKEEILGLNSDLMARLCGPQKMGNQDDLGSLNGQRLEEVGPTVMGNFVEKGKISLNQGVDLKEKENGSLALANVVTIELKRVESLLYDVVFKEKEDEFVGLDGGLKEEQLFDSYFVDFEKEGGDLFGHGCDMIHMGKEEARGAEVAGNVSGNGGIREEKLRAALRKMGVSSGGMEDVMDKVRHKHYQLACTLTFEAIHGCPNDAGINHPNQYFSDSQKMLKSKVPSIA
ncbi:unnamed protein product [Linum tenue]|uniref:DNA primase large subunit C-terminal domain-containing protein n=1 Tax=Linum tenue TaxID=586396 RepID=A0AAV0S2F7_9ROSI|nr:unnamed protein product [Linum tenue]